jgi:hypothetical protein
MNRVSPRTKRLIIAILVLVVIIIALGLAFGGQNKKAPNSGLGRMPSHADQAVVIQRR